MKQELKDLKKQVPLVTVAGARVRLEARGGEYWGCCPFHEERTPSFAIKPGAGKDGGDIFFCHGCGKGGDVINFIELSEHCSAGQAIEKLKALAGNTEWRAKAEQVQQTFQAIAAEEKQKVTFPLEKWAALTTALSKSAEALAWLRDVRGIDPAVAVALRLGYSQSCKGYLDPEDEHARDKGWILFPRIVGDKVVACKMRSIAAKAFSQWTNMDAKALYNVETINALEPVFVTEGEFDTIILEQAGFRAVSVANSTTKLTPQAKVQLKQASAVYLAGDNDGTVGNQAMRQLARELGENTYILLWKGAKDANEYFTKVCKGDLPLFTTRVNELCKKARSTPIEGFTSLLERLRNTQGTDAGNDPNRLHFPIPALDRMNYNPPGSIVVIYSTYSGTGKTVFTTQIMLHEAKRGEVVVVYSPELRDEGYLALVAAQVVGPNRDGGLDRAGVITQADYAETATRLDKITERSTDFRFYVGHSLPVQGDEKILDFIEQTIKVTGATRFVIDTLHRVVQQSGRQSMTDAEGDMVKKLELLGIKYGTIFVLIGQSNKEAEGLKEIRKDEYGVLRGSRELQDVAYGVYLLHRKRINADESNPNPDQLLSPETEVVLRKDRGKGPGASTVYLMYRRECSTFYEMERLRDPSAPPMAPPGEESYA